MRASLDGISMDQEILEIKCPYKPNRLDSDHQKTKEGKIPEKYWPQLQHQLEVFGASKGRNQQIHQAIRESRIVPPITLSQTKEIKITRSDFGIPKLLLGPPQRDFTYYIQPCAKTIEAEDQEDQSNVKTQEAEENSEKPIAYAQCNYLLH